MLIHLFTLLFSVESPVLAIYPQGESLEPKLFNMITYSLRSKSVDSKILNREHQVHSYVQRNPFSLHVAVA